jgi:hypothetical protein
MKDAESAVGCGKPISGEGGCITATLPAISVLAIEQNSGYVRRALGYGICWAMSRQEAHHKTCPFIYMPFDEINAARTNVATHAYTIAPHLPRGIKGTQERCIC